MVFRPFAKGVVFAETLDFPRILPKRPQSTHHLKILMQYGIIPYVFLLTYHISIIFFISNTLSKNPNNIPNNSTNTIEFLLYKCEIKIRKPYMIQTNKPII